MNPRPRITGYALWLIGGSAAMLLSGAVCAQSSPPPSTSAPAAANPSAQGQSSQAATPAATQAAPAAAPAPKAATPPAKAGQGAPAARNLPNRFAGRAGEYYKVVWGIDSLNVKWTESGEVIRFAWRVLDPERAKILNDKKAEPSLIDPQAGVSLVVPQMEKIGALRQSSKPEAGKSYWMAFSNKGGYVKRGHRVNIVIGTFRADGLVVD